MPSGRAKPRVTHVRTGCLTCKRRRVKCPEERPSCSRCIRAGFVCAGYAVPKTWLFESSAEAQAKAQAKADNAWTPPAGDASCSQMSGFVSPTSASSPDQLTHVSSSLPLQFGNSDPFNAYAISIGPRESYLIQFYRSDIIPELYELGSRSWMNVMAVEDWNHCMNCLKDEAAAYGLLARNAAMETVMTGGLDAPPSPAILDYMTRAQAALRLKLPLLDGSESSSTVYPIMWATCLLAGTEMILRSPTADVHLRALSNLVVRYVELMGQDLDEGSILNLVYADITRASIDPNRPFLDVLNWFPQIFQGVWKAAEERLGSQYRIVDAKVHSDVTDETTRLHILSAREDLRIFRHLRGVTLSPQDVKLISTVTQSRRLHRQGQLLNIAMDEIEHLDRPGQTIEEIQDHSARAYVPLAILLWSLSASPISIGGTVLFDPAPGILPYLKHTITKGMVSSQAREQGYGRYMDARLWALYVGAQTECNRTEVLGLNKVCGEWFPETFFKQASTMRVETWQRAVTIFEQFVHSDHMMPHISHWWQPGF